MADLAGIAFAELAMDKDGRREQPRGALHPQGITDLIVMSHGWKNSREDALQLYAGILDGARAASNGGFGGDRRFAAVGVLWPASRYRQDLSLVPDDLGEAGNDNDRGGAAAFAAAEVSQEALEQVARDFARMVGEDEDAFAMRAIAAAGGGGAADDFLKHLRTDLSAASPDTQTEHRALLREPGRELVATLAQGGTLETDPPAVPGSDARGHGAGIGQALAATGWRLLSGGKAAVATILNQATYYEMKARAGVVGEALAAIIEREVPEGVRIHLVGHSFGARLVTSACAHLQRVRPRSLTLLQAAFSHNGLGTGIGPDAIDGGFRTVVADRRVDGPIVVTHTRRDTAVGFFYAVASTASGEIAKGANVVQRLIGGPDDLHGGLGANGAQSMLDGETAVHRARFGERLNLDAGKVNNVLVDEIVSGHNDVANPDIGRLVWSAIA